MYSKQLANTVAFLPILDNETTTTFLPTEVFTQLVTGENPGLPPLSTAAASPTGAAVSVAAPPGRSTGSIGSGDFMRHRGQSKSPSVPHYHLPNSRFGPFFEGGPEPHNVSARVGSSVEFDCRIGLLQDKTVSASWIFILCSPLLSPACTPAY